MKNLANSSAAAYRDNAEPSVEEVMSDPIIHKLMASDNVNPDLLKILQKHIDALRDSLGTSASVQ